MDRRTLFLMIAASWILVIFMMFNAPEQKQDAKKEDGAEDANVEQKDESKENEDDSKNKDDSKEQDDKKSDPKGDQNKSDGDKKKDGPADDPKANDKMLIYSWGWDTHTGKIMANRLFQMEVGFPRFATTSKKVR